MAARRRRPRFASASPAPPAMPVRNWSACWPAIPRVTLTMATASQATSTPRRLPGARAHLGRRGARRSTSTRSSRGADVVFLALPEAASAELAPRLLDRGRPRHRPVRRLPPPRRRRRARSGIRPPAPCPTASAYGLTEFEARGHPRRRGCCRTPAATRPRRCWRCCRSRGAGLLRRAPTSSSTPSRASPAPARRRRSARTSPRTTAASRPTASSATATPPEMEQELGQRVTFVPHLVPLDRGHPREHLRAPRARHHGGSRWPRPSSTPTPPRRSCG